MAHEQMLGFSALITDRTRSFTGCVWVIPEIDRKLGDPRLGRIFLLTGNPGSGKTVWVARMAQTGFGLRSPGTPVHLGKERLA